MRTVGAMMILLSLAACGGEEPQREGSRDDARRREPAPPPYAPGSRAVATGSSRFAISDTVQTLTGIMVIGEEVEVFRFCGSEEETWVHDRSGGRLSAVMSDLELQPYQSFYVSVRGIVKPPFQAGPGVEYGSRLEVQEVLEASVDVSACEEQAEEVGADASAQEALPMGDAELLASGNEPSWNLNVSARGIVFARMGEDDVIFPYAEATQTNGKRVHSSRIENADDHQIEIVIEESPCSDTMSGARFTHIAEVTFDGHVYRGCARRS